jgi:DNA-binding response OmpR family regulator
LQPATILVVEDEALIAMDIQSLLEEAGYQVMGPVSTIGKAVALLKTGMPDLALLDVNLGGTDVFPLADELALREVKFIFLSGHSSRRLPDAHLGRPLISKPFLPATVLEAIEREVRGHP